MSKMIVYLDNCCFNRPFDDQNSFKVFLETQAKLMIQSFIRDEKIALIWSFILDYENSAHPDVIIKEEINCWRKVSTTVVRLDQSILDHANELTNLGFGKKDALHIASACLVKADFFVTVDNGIIKKAHFVKGTKIVNPIELIAYLEDRK